MLDLIILSPCFYEDAEPAKLMVNSASINRLVVQLYGIGEPFIPHGADAQIMKLCHLMKSEGKLAEHVLVTDCRDVLFTAGQQEILDKFKVFGSKLVMSTETGCWPPDPELVTHFYGHEPNGQDFVNAGQYIGEWDYVTLCLENLLRYYRGSHPGADNSQGWWMWAKMRREIDFTLDSMGTIFQSMSGGAGDQIEVCGERAINTLTQQRPCSLHFNGNPGNNNPQVEMYRRLFG